MRFNVVVVAVLALFVVRAHAADHPLEPLSADEMQVAFESVIARFTSDAKLPHAPLRFPIAVLSEPPKDQVLRWSTGQSFARRAEVQVFHYPSNRSWVALVDVAQKRVLKLTENPAGTEPAINAEEFDAADTAVRAYQPWRDAMSARGLDPELVFVDFWAPGDVPLSDAAAARAAFGKQTRLVRGLSFNRGAPVEMLDPKAPQNPYSRPVEGVVVTVDMNARQVIDMTDTGVRAVIADSGNAARSRPLRPLKVTQPNGSDIELHGRMVRWHDWQFYAALHPREGLVLYDVRWNDHGTWRPIAYRLALSEAYVPYGMGDPNWLWRSAFDVGEYNAGTVAQTLEVDRDVPENTQFLDALIYSDVGPSADNPSGTYAIPHSIGLYERDAGLLWTRTDPSTFDRDTRFARELVVTWNTWVGNYIYSFDWIFKLDGSIEVQVHLTGTILPRGTTAQPEASAPKVGKDAKGTWVAAPDHQHFLNFRLDLDVDGTNNHAMQMEVANLGDASFKNAFAAVTSNIDVEGFRDVDPLRDRHWHVESMMKNALGNETSYALEPTSFAVPYSTPDFPGLQRAQFAQHQLWITRYHEGERYAAGEFPNQAHAADGVGRFSSDAESLRGEDVVLWYTTGFTHITRPEDYPVMNVETIGFRLSPRGFFDRNPALEVADQVQ